MPNHLVFDFETTGVNVMKDLPVQVAIGIWNTEGKKVLLKSHILNPRMDVSPGAAKVHGINKWVIQKEGKGLRWFAKAWHELVWAHQPCVVLGYNAINFDWPILQRVLHKHGVGKFPFPPVERIVDVMFLAQRFFQMKKWPKLIASVNRLEIPHDPDSFHDAKYDVLLTWKVYKKLIRMED